MDKTPNKLVGLDNYQRSAEDEQKINDSFSIAFTAPTGIAGPTAWRCSRQQP